MLSDFERGQILAYINILMPLHRSANKVEHSKTVNFNFLQNPTIYASTKSAERPRILLK